MPNLLVFGLIRFYNSMIFLCLFNSSLSMTRYVQTPHLLKFFTIRRVLSVSGQDPALGGGHTDETEGEVSLLSACRDRDQTFLLQVNFKQPD